jgi:hypothetical protein
MHFYCIGQVPKGFWKRRENRRQFLIDLATSKGLDPFDPSTWNIIKCEDVEQAKVASNELYVLKQIDRI